MANNRMWLMHKGTSKKILIAKFYSSTGWYSFNQDILDVWLEETSVQSQYGNTDYELQFDTLREF